MYYFRVILEQKPICNSGESGNINIQQLDVVCGNKECFFLHLRNIYLKTQQELPALSETTLNIFCVHWTNSRLCYFCFNTDTKHAHVSRSLSEFVCLFKRCEFKGSKQFSDKMERTARKIAVVWVYLLEEMWSGEY